ncbi:MAG: transposase [Pseudomonadota bacterium]|nr:transposase [Pseudomonadota bacterium]
MAGIGEGFVGHCEVVEPRRGNRRWPDEVKARIVAESLAPGARVVDVAARHDLVPHQLSDWRRRARQGLLALPADLLEGLSLPSEVPGDPVFVPLAIATEPTRSAKLPETAEIVAGVMSVEIGGDVVLRVPSDAPVERAAALIRALRGAP